MNHLYRILNIIFCCGYLFNPLSASNKSLKKFLISGDVDIIKTDYSLVKDSIDFYSGMLTGETFALEMENVEPGNYTIRFHWFDKTNNNNRKMALFINGKMLTPQLEISKEMDKNNILNKDYIYIHEGGNIYISFNGYGDNAIINSVELFNQKGNLYGHGYALTMPRTRLTLLDSRINTSNNISLDNTVFYNVDHSPMGAYATFIYGMQNSGGVQVAPCGGNFSGNLVPHHGVVMALKKSDKIKVMPFIDQLSGLKNNAEYITEKEVKRILTPTSDEWSIPWGTSWKHYVPSFPLSNIDDAKDEDIKKFTIPATWMVYTFDNSNSKTEVEFLFGLKQKQSNKIETNDYIGYQIDKYSALSVHKNDAVYISREQALSLFGVEGVASGFKIKIKPGEKKEVVFYITHYMNEKHNAIYHNERLNFYYTKFFSNMEEVINTAQNITSEVIKHANSWKNKWENSNVSNERKFLIAHSTHSYRFNTMLRCTEHSRKPVWSVFEGEYGFNNTMDLTVDQLFHELILHPWTVRNNLDVFASDFSFVDSIRYANDNKRYLGGIGFTHDMGRGLNYEAGKLAYGSSPGLMTQEELQNWILCAALYWK